MITIYNVLYSKPEWTKETAITHLTENGASDILQCEETDQAVCFTLTVKPKEDIKPSRMLPITESVCLIIKDLNIPEPKEEKEQSEGQDEQKDASSSGSVGSC
jgi:hypothetical protein